MRTRPLASIALVVATLVAAFPPGAAAETIRIGIGHQSLCTDTYSGGITVKQRGLLEKHLPQTGKYAGVKYEIVWEDYTSGPPITNQMLAGKLDIGVMGAERKPQACRIVGHRRGPDRNHKETLRLQHL